MTGISPGTAREFAERAVRLAALGGTSDSAHEALVANIETELKLYSVIVANAIGTELLERHLPAAGCVVFEMSHAAARLLVTDPTQAATLETAFVRAITACSIVEQVQEVPDVPSK